MSSIYIPVSRQSPFKSEEPSSFSLFIFFLTRLLFLFLLLVGVGLVLPGLSGMASGIGEEFIAFPFISDSPCKGSQFAVYLPLASSRSSHPSDISRRLMCFVRWSLPHCEICMRCNAESASIKIILQCIRYAFVNSFFIYTIFYQHT